MILSAILGFLYIFIDLLYWVKWITSRIALKVWTASHHKRFDLYDFNDILNPEKTGYLVPKEEEELESPFPEEHLQEAADEVLFYGVNSSSQSLLVRITRSCNNESEAWIYLKLDDEHWYQLETLSGFQRTFGDKCTTFSCGGLQMHFLSPMRRWRISYCGMLKDSQNRKDVFVKFVFLWTASSDVFDARSDFSVKSAAEAMAKAKWTSLSPPVRRLTEVMNYYCQSGVLSGTIAIEDGKDIEIYLIGERIRHIGKSGCLTGTKFKLIMGNIPENGLLFHLLKLNTDHVCQNMHYGFIVHPSGNLLTIEDGLLITKMSSKEASGKNLIANFKAGKDYDLAGNIAENGIRFKSERGWNGHLEMYEIEFEIDELKGRGFMLIGEISGLPAKKIKLNKQIMPVVQPLVVSFTDDISQSTELSGGKGSSLGQLTKLSHSISSFIVPKGIIVTTAAYSDFVNRELHVKIEDLKNVAYGNTKGNVQDACERVMSAVEKTYLPDKITKEIEASLNKMFNDNINSHKFAVRSSATGEDTDQMSAAGQMETFLGIQGLKEIFNAVKKCWASQFSHIAVEYKRQNGQMLNSPMAVVIQEMVECEAAGVLFTCDPVTNNPSVVVITGNYGLGESVVSGSEEPDTIVLRKNDEDVEVKSVTVGLKQRKIVVQRFDDTENIGGTVTQDVQENERNICCVSEEVAKRLGRLALQIEKHFRSPRDIEWGILKNTIYILQSRPVTTGGTVSDYEIKHEFDSPMRCEQEYFTVCNVGEVLPGATSPLGLDVAIKFFSASMLRKSSSNRQENNFLKSKYFPSGLCPFYNHVMMNAVDLITRIGDTESLMAKSFMIGIFGRLLNDDGITQMAKYKSLSSSASKTKSLKKAFQLMKDLFCSGHGIDKISKTVFNYDSPVVKCRSAEEAFNILMNTINIHTETFTKHLLCSEMSSFWNMLIFALLAKAKGTIDNEVYSDFAKLLATQSDVESADVPSALQELAYCIAKDIKSEIFKSMSTEEARKWLQTSANTSGFKFREFLKRHGHRCLKEFDVHSVTWSDDPDSLVQLLQNLCGSCENVKDVANFDFWKMVSGLNITLDFKSKLMLRFLIPNSRRGVRERELCKSNLIKAMDNMRKGFQHVSRRMVAEGYLPNHELIYFLTINEISCLLRTRNPKLISRANHRRKLYPMLDALLFEEICKGRPVPINETNDDDDEVYISDLTMKGIPVSQGSVKGYARVALTLNEAAHLKPGEILITYSTDIGWSPYFPIIAGVVTELGGLISHGAVVSREYGLPCVVGLHGAIKKFSTGDYVLLDGSKGLLKRLPPPEK